MNSLVSIVIPVFNERGNVTPLLSEIREALSTLPHEIIFVDDGSTDGTDQEIAGLCKEGNGISALLFRRNFGQTAALAAGCAQARGDVFIFMDADGQNDPADIPLLLNKLDEGFDVVSGWRQPRHDPWLTKKLPSAIANALISKFTGVAVHDFGCTLKAYRRFTLENVKLYGEMHRFLPAWCAWKGARITEVVVHHRPRTRGQSKYGINRTLKVILDLLTTKFMSGYFSTPSYFFGGMGLALYALGSVSIVLAFYDKFGANRWPPYHIPLILLTVFAGVIGTLLLLMGLLAELVVRCYYDLSKEKPYEIKNIISN